MAGNKSKCNKKYNKNKESLKRKCIEEEAATAAAKRTKQRKASSAYEAAAPQSKGVFSLGIKNK